jgi:hypothetical protein
MAPTPPSSSLSLATAISVELQGSARAWFYRVWHCYTSSDVWFPKYVRLASWVMALATYALLPLPPSALWT